MVEIKVRSWWRSANAKAYARTWLSTRRELASGVVSGFAGGIWTAIVTDLTPWLCVLIGVAIAVAGAFAPWFLVYVFGLLTATGRDARTRLAVIEKQLVEMVIPEPVPKPAPTKALPDGVRPLIDLFGTGQLIMERCPRGFRSNVTEPQGLIDDIDEWVTETTAALEQWPKYRDQFSGEIARNDSMPWSTQEITMRMSLLMSILKKLAPGQVFVEKEKTK